jgi:tyrosyl-tRNA synthetase
VGLDGKNKMSKSLSNYIGITDEPLQMFGKVMSISDETMWEYARLLTDLKVAQLQNKHPKEAKLILAETIVHSHYSLRVAQKARQEFEKVFSKKELPSDIPVYQALHREVDVVEVIFSAKLVSSKNEARRLLEQRGISQEGIPLKTHMLTIPAQGAVLKVGKRRFLKIVYKD